MSRATVTDIDHASVGDREALRQRHGVRLVEAAEEGTAVQKLPDGVYGFTHSPAIASPLFRTFRYRAFEVHRVAGGEAWILGFVGKAEAEALAAGGERTLTLYHERNGDADTLVAVPYSRIARHRQYSVQNTPGLELQVRGADGRD